MSRSVHLHIWYDADDSEWAVSVFRGGEEIADHATFATYDEAVVFAAGFFAAWNPDSSRPVAESFDRKVAWGKGHGWGATFRNLRSRPRQRS